MLLRCFSKTWFNLGEFTLFWRKLQNVAKYAFLVLLFWAKIFICAIFYAYSISEYNVARTWHGSGWEGQAGVFPNLPCERKARVCHMAELRL